MFLLFLKLDVTHRAAQKEPDLDDSQTVSTANIEHKQTTKTIHFKYTWGRKVMTVKKKKKKGKSLAATYRAAERTKIAEAQPA